MRDLSHVISRDLVLREEPVEGSGLSKAGADGALGYIREAPELLDIVGWVVGVAPGVEDLVAEAVEGEVALEPVPLGHDEVPHGPGLGLREGLASVKSVQTRNGRAGSGIKYVHLRHVIISEGLQLYSGHTSCPHLYPKFLLRSTPEQRPNVEGFGFLFFRQSRSTV